MKVVQWRYTLSRIPSFDYGETPNQKKRSSAVVERSELSFATPDSCWRTPKENTFSTLLNCVNGLLLDLGTRTKTKPFMWKTTSTRVPYYGIDTKDEGICSHSEMAWFCKKVVEIVRTMNLSGARQAGSPK